MKNDLENKQNYLVKIPHTKQECLGMLDDLKSKGEEVLSNFKFACATGDHTAYAIFEGKTETEIKNMLPMNVRQKAIITKVEAYSLKDIEEMHIA